MLSVKRFWSKLMSWQDSSLSSEGKAQLARHCTGNLQLRSGFQFNQEPDYINFRSIRSSLTPSLPISRVKNNQRDVVYSTSNTIQDTDDDAREKVRRNERSKDTIGCQKGIKKMRVIPHRSRSSALVAWMSWANDFPNPTSFLENGNNLPPSIIVMLIFKSVRMTRYILFIVTHREFHRSSTPIRQRMRRNHKQRLEGVSLQRLW